TTNCQSYLSIGIQSCYDPIEGRVTIHFSFITTTTTSVAMMRVTAPSIYILASQSETPPLKTPPSGTPPLLPIPAPTSSPSLLLPSADHGADMPMVCLPPRKRLCFAFGPRYKVGESSSTPTARPLGEFATRVRQDTYEIYVRLDDEQTERPLMAGRLNMLYRDRRTHARTALLLEREARMSQEAWG
ncbi:hypothetical protein Tco_0050104, partial [Tanacetum coccineum]